MSAQTFSNVIAGTTTFQSFRENYNNVASEMNTGVLRLNGPAVVGNVTLNGSATFSQPLQLISTFVVNNATFQQNTTNRLENRDGVLFFDGKRVRRTSEYNAVYGYVLGGVTGARVATSDRITFSASTSAAHTPTNLSQGRMYSAGLSDASTYGYVHGGWTGGYVVTADRITFSTSTTAAHTPANLSQARENLLGISDGVLYGYTVGGVSASGVTVVTAEQINFSSSTLAAHTPANLSVARNTPGGLSNKAAYGYILGGGTTTTDRITFSTSITAAHTPANLTDASQYKSLSDNGLYGYLNVATGPSTNVYRFNFSTEATAAHTSAYLSQARIAVTGVSDGNLYGYFCGGWTGGIVYVTTTDRITFSTSTTAAHTPANLSQARSNSAGFPDLAV